MYANAGCLDAGFYFAYETNIAVHLRRGEVRQSGCPGGQRSGQVRRRQGGGGGGHNGGD